MDIIPWYVTVIRLAVPFLIIRWQLSGIILALFADMYDWKLIRVVSSQDVAVYQAWDKALDLYYWLFIVWVVVRTWREVWAKKAALLFFGYRLVGMGLFWVSGWRPLLFFFPNVFENFVIWCLVLFLITKRQKLALTAQQKHAMLGALIIPKLIHEYFQHVLGIQPWQLYNVGKWLGWISAVQEYANFLVWGGLLYGLPFVWFLLFIFSVPKKHANLPKKLLRN